ncbi:polysaccharide pyruvyl transferase family protein [Celeribacter sp.]|uniref:polysaccharide pyruvyl transferase family protein n=1 Tax=Celeribacter sp. TaxID=1890673 RepID=UPI003A8CAD31
MLIAPDIDVLKPGKLTRLAQRFGLLSGADSHFWSWYNPYNFGDWIGPYLYYAITGRRPNFRAIKYARFGSIYMSVGSILHHIHHPGVAVVWGSGVISRSQMFAAPRKICAVRGPLTRERCLELGYECGEIYGDPAILLPDFLKVSSQPNARVGLVPHFVHLDVARKVFGDRPDIKIIDVTRPLWNVAEEIATSEVVVSSSLHGLIVGHSYGRPSLYVDFADAETSLHGDGVKFADYHLAGGISEVPDRVMLTGEETTAWLENMAHQAPMPDLEPLKGPLRASCPYIDKKEGGMAR